MLERSDVLKMGAFFEMDTGLRRYDVNTPSACCGVVYFGMANQYRFPYPEFR